jgi:Resolvase, N terminal domain
VTIYGYARVSTDGQTLAAQDAALHAAGCAKVYSETASGAVTDRKALARALAVLKEGGTLIVTRLDRLAQSTRDLLDTLDTIARKGAGFKSLTGAWADTTTPHGRLMLTVLGACRVRARTYPGSHRRGPGTRQGERRPHGAPAEADAAPTARGVEASRCRREPDGHRPHLWRGAHHDSAAVATVAPPTSLTVAAELDRCGIATPPSGRLWPCLFAPGRQRRHSRRNSHRTWQRRQNSHRTGRRYRHNHRARHGSGPPGHGCR